MVIFTASCRIPETMGGGQRNRIAGKALALFMANPVRIPQIPHMIPGAQPGMTPNVASKQKNIKTLLLTKDFGNSYCSHAWCWSEKRGHKESSEHCKDSDLPGMTPYTVVPPMVRNSFQALTGVLWPFIIISNLSIFSCFPHNQVGRAENSLSQGFIAAIRTRARNYQSSQLWLKESRSCGL